jgi:uncharacterized protein YdeI (YjbR/CyaY-like superfamily)
MPKTPKATRTPNAQSFEVRLERMRSRLNWVIVHVPFDAARVWGLRGQIKVKGEINGFAFRTSLFPTGEGRHYLLINKRMQKGAGASEGRMAGFRMELDLEERKVTLPEELDRFLKQDRTLRRWYDGLNHSTRNDIAKWTSEPKSAPARTRRAEQMAERLLSVMDAERELPPVLKLAFARDPKAVEGWNRMSAARRRSLLFAVFYYQTPEARNRRIDKVLEEAAAVADRKVFGRTYVRRTVVGGKVREK